MISERTKAALAAAKARGTRLGNPRISEAAALGWASLEAATAQSDANVLPIVRELEAAGVTSRNAIAAELNKRGVRTARGGAWTHVQVGMNPDRIAINHANFAGRNTRREGWAGEPQDKSEAAARKGNRHAAA